mgnify:CR=1 FL=1
MISWQKTVNLFDAEIYQAPFDEHTLKDINTWVSQKIRKSDPTDIRQNRRQFGNVSDQCHCF